MKIRHYYSISKLSRNHKWDLSNLIDACYFTEDFESVIDEEREKSAFFIYDCYDNIVGFASVEENFDSIHISYLYVESNSRCKGYGSFLIEAVRKYAKQKGVDTIYLNVALTNYDARKLYVRRRFLYDYICENFSVAEMKMFTSNNAYCLGGILYEISKTFGKENLSKGIEYFKSSGNYSKFYPYVRSKNKDEFIQRVFDSNVLQDVNVFISELKQAPFNPRTIIAKMTSKEGLNDNLQPYFPRTYDGQSKNFRMIGLGCDAFESFEKNEELQESIVYRIQMDNEKTRIV